VANKAPPLNYHAALITEAVFYNLFHLLKLTLNSNAAKFNLHKSFKAKSLR